MSATPSRVNASDNYWQPGGVWHNFLVGITARQFEQLQQRLTGGKRAVEPVFQNNASGPANSQQVILGIDPSLRGTGYGVIRVARPFPQTLLHGTISCPGGWERSRCLVKIVQGLRETLKKYSPEVCAIEGLFYAQNLQTALIMGEARGAALATIAEFGI